MQILLSGPDFHEYNEFVARGLRDLGQDVSVSDWPDLWGSLMDRTRLYFARRFLEEFEFQTYVLDVVDETVRAYNDELLDRIRRERPEIFLVLNGKILLPETVSKASEYTTTVLWCYDKATAFPAVVRAADDYDLFYAFEASDVDDLGGRGIDVTYLPLGYDPSKYHPIEDNECGEEPVDVSFVGTLTDRRKKLLDRILDAFPEIDLRIWGNNWSWYDPFGRVEYRLRRRRLGNRLHNYNIPAERVNEVYNRSKICLNVQGKHNQQSMNARTFEIPGAGGFQLVDNKPRLQDELAIGEEVAVYETGDELVEQVRHYLNNPDERHEIARRGHQRAVTQLRYQDRLERILDDYYSYGNKNSNYL